MTAAENEIVCWLLNFRIRMFVKSAVITKIRTLSVSNVGYFFIVATSVSLEIPTESHIIYLREDHGLPAYPPKIFSPLLITTRVGDFPSHLL